MTESDTRGLEDSPTGSSSSTDTRSNAAPTEVHPTSLTQFQTDILAILAEEARYGLAIKRELEAYHGEDVNHGRLYPNLDDLVALDLVEKSELDKRTNNYELTERGRQVVVARTHWLLDVLGSDGHRLAGAEPARTASGGDD